MKITIYNSDYIGAISGILCLIHCIATPLLFLINVELVTQKTILILQIIGYLFLIVSFLAVLKSAQNSSSYTVKVLFFVFWILLFGLVLNEPLGFFRIPEIFTFLSAFSLSALHIYNLKYCKCEDKNCCTSNQQFF
jgi:hypothetical protein